MVALVIIRGQVIGVRGGLRVIGRGGADDLSKSTSNLTFRPPDISFIQIARRGGRSPGRALGFQRPPGVDRLVALARRLRAPPPEDELELALRRTREATALPARDRRRAVGWLSRLLVSRDRHLAGVASELAWSERTPDADALTALSTEVDQEVDR